MILACRASTIELSLLTPPRSIIYVLGLGRALRKCLGVLGHSWCYSSNQVNSLMLLKESVKGFLLCGAGIQFRSLNMQGVTLTPSYLISCPGPYLCL